MPHFENFCAIAGLFIYNLCTIQAPVGISYFMVLKQMYAQVKLHCTGPIKLTGKKSSEPAKINANNKCINIL